MWTLSFPLENCPWERMLTVAMREAGAAATPCSEPAAGPVIGAQHSTVRPTDFRYFDDPRTFTPPCDAFQPDAVRGIAGISIVTGVEDFTVVPFEAKAEA